MREVKVEVVPILLKSNVNDDGVGADGFLAVFV